MDRAIQSAIEWGELNANSIPFVKNWCAHVRVERMSGRGMIEAATGLPIGHHGLACDHAPAGGMMSYDIRDAALDFYDRNCHDCKLRKPVSIPNIGSWVADRDAALAEQRAADEAAELEAKAKHQARRATRAHIKIGLTPAAADVIDQLDELDDRRTMDLTGRLAQTARLAPDAFPQPIVDYLFDLLEGGETWADEASLQALDILNADPARLARCSAQCLSGHRALRTAARTLSRNRDAADATIIPDALPALIRQAAPSREHWSVDEKARISPLILIASRFPDAVAKTLDGLLDGGPAQVDLAACAIEVLARRHPAMALRFTRDLISKLVRAPWIPDPEDYGHDEAHERIASNIRDGIVATFHQRPREVDQLLQNFRLGASDAGETRIFSVYQRTLNISRFRKRNRPVSDADRLAFRRLLWEAPKTNNEKVLQEIRDTINSHPSDTNELAAEEIDSLIGAAIQMNARVLAFDAEPKPENTSWIDVMERGNRRLSLTNLRNNFISWAATGAAAAGNPAAYLDVLEGLPEADDDLAGVMIEKSVALMETADGLNTVLPKLYSGLLSPSVVRRGRAVSAVGEMSWRQRDNAPELLFEAFLTTLTDPYIYVHHAAVMALRRFKMPEKFDAEVRSAIWNILLAHWQSGDHQDLIVECVELLARRYLNERERAGRPGAFLVTVLSKLPSWRLSNELRGLSRDLAHAEGWIDLLVSILTDPESRDYTEEVVLEVIGELPPEVIFAHREKLAAIPVAKDRQSRYQVFEMIQALSRARCWEEAERLAKAALDAIPETTHEAHSRHQFQLLHAAACFEHAQAQGDTACAAQFAERWRRAKSDKEATDDALARRPDPLRDLRRPT